MPSYTSRQRLLGDQEVAELYAKLKDSETVGCHAGCSAATVLAIARKFGVEIQPRGKAGQTLKAFRPGGTATLTMDQVEALYRGGVSGPEIAHRANVTPGAVYAILKKRNVPRRLPFGRPKKGAGDGRDDI